MILQNIFYKLSILILLISNFSFSFDFTPIPILFHKYYSFSLNEYSKFIIYSFKNDMDPEYELIFRFSEIPRYESKLYLYFSEIDISQNLETLIKCNPYTGEFFESFYNINIGRIRYTNNNEIILNSNNCQSQYLMPGYIFAVISIVSISKNPVYTSNIMIYNTKYMPEISTSKSYEYFKFGGPYRKPITFFIPEISSDIILRQGFNSSDNNKKYLNIYQNNLNGTNLFFQNSFYSTLDKYIKLIKGNSYYIKFTDDKNTVFNYEILFQFPSDEFIKIEEGKEIYTSSFIYDEYYYFYYNNIKMNIGDSFYFKIIQNYNSHELLYKELIYNDYDYICQRKNTYDVKYCTIIYQKEFANKITNVYKCEKEEESQAFIFLLRSEKNDRIFPHFAIELISKNLIINPENIQKSYNKGGIGFYSLKLNDLSSKNKNILIYSNENRALNIYCSDLYYIDYYLKNDFRNYTNLRLFFLDPSKPETQRKSSSYTSEYYTIIIYEPSLEEYSLDIKFIDKNFYFVKEFDLHLDEKIIRRTFYNNVTSNLDIFQIINYTKEKEEKFENYSICYQELYGDYETEMIILDNIKVKTLNELLNPDLSFNKNYAIPLSDPSILGRYIITHIKINSKKEIPLPFDHIAFYENILKINYYYPKRLTEGKQIILFLEKEKPSYIYFDSPYREFNVEIKFMGKADSKGYNVNINICNGKEVILNSNNKIIRTACKNVDNNSNITFINKGINLTAIIVKRALPLKDIKYIISNSYDRYIYASEKITLIKFEKGLKYLYYFFNEIYKNYNYGDVCLFQEYADLDYIAYPSEQTCFSNKDSFLSYNNLSVDNDLIYSENNAKGKIIDSDTLFLIINNIYDGVIYYFKKVYNISGNNIEAKDYRKENKFDIFFCMLPKKGQLKNYDSLFIQVFSESDTNDYNNFVIYNDSEPFTNISGRGNFYDFVNLSDFKEDNQIYLYPGTTYSNAYFRFKLYNSKEADYINYDYKKNSITSSGIHFNIKDNNRFPYKIEFKPSYPQETNGCSNYYFFILDPKYYQKLSIKSYHDFLNLNSSVFYQNFTANNVCSSNSKFLEKDLDKFTFEFKYKQSKWLSILGFSEQVGLFKAIKFHGFDNFYYEYNVIEFNNINMKINDKELFNWNEDYPETTKYKITLEEEGLLNIFWKGSNKSKIQEVEIYKDFLTNPSNLIYHSLNISNYEHNFSVKTSKQTKFLLIYKSIDDENNRTIYFDFTHNLGKEIIFKSNKNDVFNYNKWIVYSSGTYKFFTKIAENDNSLDDYYTYRYSFKNNNYNYVSKIRLSYFNENETLIKSYGIEGNVNKKFVNPENITYFYFMPGDNIKRRVEKEKLKYIQIEFLLNFKDEGGPEALDELLVERIIIEKIKGNNWNKNIKNFIKENSGKFGIFYINLDEAIFELNQNVLFYSNTKNYSDILNFGNILDFSANPVNISEYIYSIGKQFLVFTKETINNYKTKNDEHIILLSIDGTNENEKLYEDNIFLEFKFLDSYLNDIQVNEEGNRSIITPEKSYFFDTNIECSKKKYIISYYPSSESEKQNIYFSKNIYGNVDIYYINQDSIFSGAINSIDEILPDKNDKYLINQHPNEISKGALDIFAITCKKAPALAIFYTFEKKEQSRNIIFTGYNNTFIGYIFPENSNQLEKKYIFNNINDEEFNIKLKILKIIGFSGIDIKYKKNDSEEYSIINEGQESIINSSEYNPSFKINENGIGKGIIFFEIIKEISIDNNLFVFSEETVFNSKLSPDKYALIKYNRNQIDSWSSRLIIFNENNNDTKIYVKYDYFTEPYISLPNCIEYENLSKNSHFNILINNPYKINQNLLRTDRADFYTVLKSDSPIKYIYLYSNDKENLELNKLKTISGTGEFPFQIEEKSSENQFFIYQIYQCFPNNNLYFSFGSKLYDVFENNNYGIQKKDETNMFFSIINQGGEKIGEADLYFVLSESDINNENIDDLINQKASFSHRQDKNNIIFSIDNFAEEEFEYYSIMTLYNNTDDLSNFCFFIDFFNNNTNTLFSKTTSSGKGLKSKTIITHSINEECFSNNCTIMVFAKSKKKNISKIYTPIILNILEKYEKKGDPKVLNIILYTSMIILIFSILLIIIIWIRKKKQNNNKDNTIEINNLDSIGLEKNENQKNEKMLDINSFFRENEENNLPSESEVYQKTFTGKDFSAPPTYIGLP